MTVVVFKGKSETLDAKSDDNPTAHKIVEQDQKKEQADQIARDSCSDGVKAEDKYPDFGAHKGGYLSKVEELGDQIAEKGTEAKKEEKETKSAEKDS